MKVITAYSHKGGTGKTTALMMLASAIDAAGKSALLIDCDPHEAFKAYETYSRQGEMNRWSDRFEVRYMHYEATKLDALEDALLDADESGRFDYCLINLAGVDHPFNRHVLRYAEMTLLPFAPSALDLMELPGALKVIKDLAEDGEIGDARVVFTKMKPKSKWTVAQTAYVESVLEGFPYMETKIRETAVLGDLVMRGLLGRTIQIGETSATGLQLSDVKRHREALADCQELFDEVNKLIEKDDQK